jgi:hypothetical protein
MGVTATLSVVRVNVFVFTHACELESAAEPWKVPEETSDHRLTWVRVSVVETFVHGPAVPVIAFDPAEAEAIVACLRDVSPAAAAVAPAEPGSAVCSFTQALVVENVPSSQPFTTEAARPVVTWFLP